MTGISLPPFTSWYIRRHEDFRYYPAVSWYVQWRARKELPYESPYIYNEFKHQLVTTIRATLELPPELVDIILRHLWLL